jgi:hypothetical protein
MGRVTCKLPKNTRGAQYRYKTVSAPLLQFADDTLPSLTLVNVEDTRFGVERRDHMLLSRSGKTQLGSEQNFVTVEFASESGSS